MLGYKNRHFEYASLINSGLLVFFKLIFDQEVYSRVRKFYGLVFFRIVFWDFRRSSLSFLTRSTPPSPRVQLLFYIRTNQPEAQTRFIELAATLAGKEKYNKQKTF